MFDKSYGGAMVNRFLTGFRGFRHGFGISLYGLVFVQAFCAVVLGGPGGNL